MIESFMQSPIIWAILSVCTLIGVPSFIYTIVSREKVQISYAKCGYNIISLASEITDKMKVYYNGYDVDSVSVSKYAIWNSGNRVIEESSFVTGKPLSILTKNNEKILSVSILQVTDEDNHIEIGKYTEDNTTIQFEYLNPNDGAIIQVVHTGTRNDIVMTCKIKGGSQLKPYHPEKFLLPLPSQKITLSKMINIQSIVGFFILVGFVTICILGENGIIPKEFFVSQQSPQVEFLFFKILTGVFAVTYFGSNWVFFHNVYKIGIPKPLRKAFIEDKFEN